MTAGTCRRAGCDEPSLPNSTLCPDHERDSARTLDKALGKLRRREAERFRGDSRNVIYVGVRGEGGCTVTADGWPLPLRLDLANHSPTGFSWGYNGSGPAQLALALLAYHTGHDAVARRLHQQFKFQVIAGIRQDRWTMTGEEIAGWFNRAALTEDAVR